MEAGSPVWVLVKIENNSDSDLRVYRAISSDMDQGGWVYGVDVFDDKGNPGHETKFYRVAQGRDPDISVRTSGGAIKLKPGKFITDRVNVSKLYDLNEQGKYTIQIQRFDSESKTFLKSNEITVTITPKQDRRRGLTLCQKT